MTLKREIKDAYIEKGAPIYVKTHSNAVYVDENETETLTKRLDNVKDSIKEHTSQLNDIKEIVVKLPKTNGIDDTNMLKEYLTNASNTTFIFDKNGYTISDTIVCTFNNVELRCRYSPITLTNNNKIGFQILNSENVTIDRPSVKSNETNTDTLFHNHTSIGIAVDNSENVKITNGDISYFRFAIMNRYSNNIEFYNNKLHDLGGEGMVLREVTNFKLIGNELYNHKGDGFLLKQYEWVKVTNGLIENNTIRDGQQNPVDSVTIGGGITSNAENTSGLGYKGQHDGLIIRGNTFKNVNYGVILIGCANVFIEDNVIRGTNKCAIGLDSIESQRNENRLPYVRWFIRNNIMDTGKYGLFMATKKFEVNDILIDGNIIKNFTNEPCQLINSTFKNNVIKANNKTAIIDFGNCQIIGNKIYNATTGIDNRRDTILNIDGSAHNETSITNTSPSHYENNIFDNVTNYGLSVKNSMIINNEIYNSPNAQAINATNSIVSTNKIDTCKKGISLINSRAINNTLNNIITGGSAGDYNNLYAIKVQDNSDAIANTITNSDGIIVVTSKTNSIINDNNINSIGSSSNVIAFLNDSSHTNKQICKNNFLNGKSITPAGSSNIISSDNY